MFNKQKNLKNFFIFFNLLLIIHKKYLILIKIICAVNAILKLLYN